MNLVDGFEIIFKLKKKIFSLFVIWSTLSFFLNNMAGQSNYLANH